MFRLPKRKINPVLWTILLISAALHVVVIGVIGGITIYQGITQRDATFEAPEQHEVIERQRIEMQARTQERQRQTRRPQQRLQVRSPADVNLPSVDIQVPDLQTRVAVEGMGRGMGEIGAGSGLNISPATVTIQDIQATGEKFLFVIDADRYLMIDSRGGMPTYDVIKEDIIREVRNLPTGVLFNAMVYERFSIQFWRPSLQPKGERTVKEFEEWLRPINADYDRLGVRGRTDRPEYLPGEIGRVLGLRTMNHGLSDEMGRVQGLRRGSLRNNERWHAVVAALEQQADSIFWLAPDAPQWDGLIYYSEEAWREAIDSTKEMRKRENFMTPEREYDDEAFRRARQELEEKTNEFIREENRRRERQGLPPRVYNVHERDVVRDEVADENRMPRLHRMYRGPSRVSVATVREMQRWIDQVQRVHYDDNGLSRPALHMIIFKGRDEEWGPDDNRRVRDFVRQFRGRFRVLFGLGQIDDQRERERQRR